MQSERYVLERQMLDISTAADTDLHDLTPQALAFLERSELVEGSLLVFTPGSTAGITTIEFEDGAVRDFKRLCEQLAPSDGNYAHNLRWGDGNGYSHVRAALLGPSMTVPIVDGQLLLGSWQQIALCDFDNRPRRRRVLLQLEGRSV